MPQLHSSIVVSKSWSEVLEILKRTEEFPSFMPAIEGLDVMRRAYGGSISTWKVNINGTILQWKQEDKVDAEEGRIDFHMLDGDYAS